MPPMACLFSPWPGEACWSTTSVCSPRRAERHGGRARPPTPRRPRPRRRSSVMSQFSRAPAKAPSGTSTKSGRAVVTVPEVHPLLAKEAPDHGAAGLAAAGAHAGAGEGLELVQVAHAGADGRPDVAGGTRSQRQMMASSARRRLGVDRHGVDRRSWTQMPTARLATARSPAPARAGSPGTLLRGLDLHHREAAQLLPVHVRDRDHLAGLRAARGELVGQRQSGCSWSSR